MGNGTVTDKNGHLQKLPKPPMRTAGNKDCPEKTKVGHKWYQSIGFPWRKQRFALVLIEDDRYLLIYVKLFRLLKLSRLFQNVLRIMYNVDWTFIYCCVDARIMAPSLISGAKGRAGLEKIWLTCRIGRNRAVSVAVLMILIILYMFMLSQFT